MSELMDLLIEYEALQHHLHITCYETDLAEFKPDEGREAVEVVEHHSETQEQLSIPHNGQKITFSGCYYKAPGDPVLYGDIELASVIGNALLIHFNHVEFQAGMCYQRALGTRQLDK